MEYIQKNMCDKSNVYKFDNFKTSAEVGSSTQTRTNQQRSSSSNLNRSKRVLRSASRNRQMEKEQEDNAEMEENGSSGDAPASKCEEEKLPQRDRLNRTNLNMLDKIEKFNERLRNKRKRQDDENKGKVFKVWKRPKNRSSQESPCDTSLEDQKNGSSESNFLRAKNGSGTDSNSNAQTQTSYICLSNGKIVIKGNEIETTVPWDIQTINNKVSMISPHYPVKVTMVPLALNGPHVYDPKSNSFTSKESYQSSGQNGSGERISGTGLNAVTSMINSGNGNSSGSRSSNILSEMMKGFCQWPDPSSLTSFYQNYMQPMHHSNAHRSVSQALVHPPNMVNNSPGSSNPHSME